MSRSERDAAQTEAAYAVERMTEVVLACNEPELAHRWYDLLKAWAQMLETQDLYFGERLALAVKGLLR